jgi:hypothetical protein
MTKRWKRIFLPFIFIGAFFEVFLDGFWRKPMTVEERRKMYRESEEGK